MDFLDPQKQRKQRYIFGIGYFLIAVAILIATVILLYLAYGYGFGKNGQIIQKGLVFLSTQPNPASIYINDELVKQKTDTRIQLPAGDYDVKMTRPGYRDWERSITVGGASVQHFDYPFLFPTKLVSSSLHTDQMAPPLALQSPDRRWLLTEQAANLATFSVYDLNNPKSTSTSITIPDTILTKPDAGGTESFQLAEWSTDNKHILLSHIYTGGQEYIMLDRTAPENSVNVTRQLKLAAGQQVTLRNKEYDHYFVLDPTTQTLSTADLGNVALVTYLENVLAFKSYGTDTVLYASSQNVAADKAQVILHDNSNDYPIRLVDAEPPYLLDLTKYNSTFYAALGASGDNEVYVYQDPIGQQQRSPSHTAVPVSILRVTAPNYLSFSNNAQFIVIENGPEFAVYNAESDNKYTYTVPTPLDAGQAHAVWMDGDRLTLVSGGKLDVFDYDHANAQTLSAASPRYQPFFDRNYKFLYTLTPAGSKYPEGTTLTSTSMLIPKDQ